MPGTRRNPAQQSLRSSESGIQAQQNPYDTGYGGCYGGSRTGRYSSRNASWKRQCSKWTLKPGKMNNIAEVHCSLAVTLWVERWGAEGKRQNSRAYRHQAKCHAEGHHEMKASVNWALTARLQLFVTWECRPKVARYSNFSLEARPQTFM